MDSSSRRYVVALVVLAAFGLGLLADEACTITVQPGESIQAAIDAAPEGAVICLAAGEWRESLRIVDRSLTLLGEGAGKSTIRGHRFDLPVIHVYTRRKEKTVVTLAGLRIADCRGHSLANGIRIENAAHVEISDCTIESNSAVGIIMLDASLATITGSTVRDNEGDGIFMRDSAQATMMNVTIAGNSGHGVDMQHATQATIRGSTIRDNGGNGVIMWSSSRGTLADSIIAGNASTGISVLGYAASIEDSDIKGNGWHGIWISSSAETSIVRSTISDNARIGIGCSQPAHVTGFGNTVPGPDESDGNRERAFSPDELAFLITGEGGTLDMRE